MKLKSDLTLGFSRCPLSRVLHVTLANWQRFGFEFHLRSSPSAYRGFVNISRTAEYFTVCSSSSHNFVNQYSQFKFAVLDSEKCRDFFENFRQKAVIFNITHNIGIKKNPARQLILRIRNIFHGSITWLVPPQAVHTICLGSRLLCYSKCTRFTVCLTYSHISLTVYINQ